MWELDHKEGWAPKNWYLLTVVLEKTLESSLDSKEIKPINPKGNLPWMFIGRKATPNLDSVLKNRDIILTTSQWSKLHFYKVMYECDLDHKEGWAPKNWYFWIVVLEKTLESTLDCDEIKWVNSRGNQLLMFLERLMLKQKLHYFGHLTQCIGKGPDAGKYWKQKEKDAAED